MITTSRSSNVRRLKRMFFFIRIALGSTITSVLSERRNQFADQKTERGKVLNPEYSIDRDQPTSRASPLRINTLLYGGCHCFWARITSGLDIRHWLVCGSWFSDSSRACRRHEQFELPPNYASAKPGGCWAYFNLDSFKRNATDSLPAERFCVNQ